MQDLFQQAADGLHNLRIGGPYATQGAFRIVCPPGEKRKVSAIRAYIIGSGHPEYSGGNGGILKVTVHEDAPTGIYGLTSSIEMKCEDIESFPLITFTKEFEMTPGKAYWFVFNNLDNTPAENYFSINFMYCVYSFSASSNIPQLVYQKSPYLNNNSEWVEFKPMNGCTPIISFYKPGFARSTHLVHEDFGYSLAESSIESEKVFIGGNQSVYQTLKFKETVKVRRIGLRVATSPDAPRVGSLLMTVSDCASGKVLGYSVCSPPEPVAQWVGNKGTLAGHTWVYFDFFDEINFNQYASPEGYKIEVKGTDKTRIGVFALRGGACYGFHKPGGLEGYAWHNSQETPDIYKRWMDGKWGDDPQSFLPLRLW